MKGESFASFWGHTIVLTRSPNQERKRTDMSKDTKAKIGIFSLTLLAMASLGITPSIALIMEAFPESSASDVQQLTAIPNLMAIIMALAFSVIANKIPRKVIALAGPIFVAIGGLLPYFMGNSLLFLLVCSGIVGLGVGCITNITQVLITELISPEKRQAAMAQNVIFVNVGAIIMTMGGGMLAANGWKNNYLVYAVAIPVLILTIIFIPFYKPAIMDEADANKAAGPKPSLGVKPFLVASCILVTNLVYSAFANNASILIIAGGIGDSSAVGLVNSVATIGGMVAGAILGKILTIPAIGRRSLALGLVLMGCGMVVLASTVNVTVMCVAAFFIGFALSVGFAQTPFVISLTVAPMLIPTAISMYAMGSSIGGTISPTLINGIAGAFLSGSGADCCYVGAAIAFIAAALLLVTNFQGKIIDAANLPAGQE